PERIVMVVEIILKRKGRRARAVGRKCRAAAIELLLGWRHDDNRDTAASEERERAIGQDEIVEAEGLREEGTDKATGRLARRILKFREGVEMRLADAEGGRNLLADRQPLADAIILFRLVGGLPAVDAGDHGRGDEVAFQ